MANGGAGDVLGRRALNRALLARQFLLRPTAMDPLDLVDHLVGLQAQAPFPPYFGLWSRLERFHPDELAGPLVDRRVVRLTLMRGTVHLVGAADAVRLRPLFRRYLARALTMMSGPEIAALDAAEVAEATVAALADRELTSRQLGDVLAERWPEHDPAGLGTAGRIHVPLIQVPPRGVWGQSAQTAYATLDGWLDGRPAGGPPATADDLVMRYLTAFGPASPRDAQAWSGLTGLGEVFGRLRPRLRAFRDEQGRELFDLPDAPRPDPDTAAPARFVAEFDNVLLSHADKTRVVDDAHRKAFMTVNGLVKGTVLVDGFVAGTWQLERGAAPLTVTPFRRLPKKAVSALTTQGRRLLAFAAPEAGPEIRFAESTG